MHDPDRTVAIICGASSWPQLQHFSAAAAFANTARRLRDYLTDEQWLGLAESNVLDLFDSAESATAHLDRIAEFLRAHIRRTRGKYGRGLLILVAYIGHGAFFDAEHAYCLLLRDTHEPIRQETSLRVASLARVLKSVAPRSARIAILDCCFAAHAVSDFQSEIEQIEAAGAEEVVGQEEALERKFVAEVGPLEAAGITDSAVRERICAALEEATTEEIDNILARESATESDDVYGVALLCAASAREPARLASRNTYTLFGSVLLDVLEGGESGSPLPPPGSAPLPSMSLRQVGRLIDTRLRAYPDAPRPQVHTPIQGDGRDLADEPLFPNAGHERVTTMDRGRGRRAARVAAVVVVLLAGVVAGRTVWDHWDRSDFLRAHCDTAIVTLSSVGAECIGMTDGSHDLFQPASADPGVQDRIRQVENTVAAQNRTAAQLHAKQPARPYATLVDVEALTAPEGGTAAELTAERESFEGIAVAQKNMLDAAQRNMPEADSATTPILRILLANAGRGMTHGTEIAAQVVAAARSDPSIVGAIGMNMSNESAKNTIAALYDAHIATVATTLSSDSLADLISDYVQVAPQDRNEAATVAGFAARLPTARTATIYYSGDSQDLYSMNLRDDARYWFGRFGFEVKAVAFVSAQESTGSQHPQPGDQLMHDAEAAGKNTCTDGGVAFFAGRGIPDYADFLAGASACGGPNPSILMGDDDVTKHVADPVTRHRTPGIPYYFVSFAPAPVTDARTGATSNFYDQLADLFPFEKTPADERSLDGHAALSFDAMQVYRAAIDRQPSNSDHRASAIAQQLAGLGTFEGVTGTFEYGGRDRPNVPKHKPVTILRVEDGSVVPVIQAYCGHFAARVERPADWCPADADEQPAGGR